MFIVKINLFTRYTIKLQSFRRMLIIIFLYDTFITYFTKTFLKNDRVKYDIFFYK